MRHKTAIILRRLTNNRAEYRRAKKTYNRLPRNKRYAAIDSACEFFAVYGMKLYD